MRGAIKISPERCKGCSYCKAACPAGVISISAHFNKKGFFPAVVKHPEKCTGCAICGNMCPEVAIEVYRGMSPSKKKIGKQTGKA